MPPPVSSLLSLPSSSQSVELAREPPTERENEPRAETSLLGPPLKKLPVLGLLRGSGCECGELDEVAAIQGQIGDLLRSNHLAERRIGGLHGDSSGGHFNALLHIGGRKRKIDFALFINLQADIFYFVRL